MKERVVDIDLVPNPKEALERHKHQNASHVKKRKRRAGGTSVEFDPEHLRKYVTGFRKRKLQRKEYAKKKIAEMEKKAKRIKRKEKEQELKRMCGMKHDQKWSDESSSAESEALVSEKTEVVYTTEEYKTVVQVRPLHLGAVSNDE